MAYTDVELILDQLEDIKDISSAELSLIEQLSVKMLPDKVVNQSSRLKGAMANPVTASNGISKYINLRITAINQAISEIKSKWNEVIPLSTSDITTLKTRLDTLTMGVSQEYNSLYKIEQIVKAIKGNPTSDYNSLEKLENKLKQEITDRDNAIKTSIDSLIDDSPQALDTLRELSKALGDDPNFSTTILNKIAQTLTDSKAYTDEKISQEVQDRNSAITSNVTSAVSTAKEELIGGATSSYNTMGKLETAIKQITGSTEGSPTTIEGAILKANEYTDSAIEKLVGTSSENLDTLQELAQALGNDPNFATTVLNKISAIKGTPTSDYDSLEKIENKLKEEVKAREQAIEEIYDEVPQTIECNHEYEITGNTNDEQGLAVKDQQMLLKRIEGQTGRYSENELKLEDVSETTRNGVTYSIKNGVITLNGICTDYFEILQSIVLPMGKYYINLYNNSVPEHLGNTRFSFDSSNDTYNSVFPDVINKFKTFEASSSITKFRLILNANVEFDNFIAKIMLVKGTYTEDTIPTFKPYDNTLVNAKCNFISTGKQLWNEEWEVGGLDETTGEPIIATSSIRSKNYTAVLPNTSFYLTNSNNNVIKLFEYDNNFNFISSKNLQNGTLKTSNTTYYIKLRSSSNYGNTYKHDIMLNYGTKALPYEPYTYDSITYNRELTAYGYHDNETNMTVEYGSEVITVDGSSDENWTLQSINEYGISNFSYAFSNVVGKFYIITNSNLPIQTTLISITDTEGIFPGYNGSLYIRLNSSTASTVEAFRVWLSQNPISLVYKQSTPRYTIEEYLPNGYDVYSGGMQIQSIEGKYLPYNLTKVYSVSIADQLNANREIDKGQQEQIDEVKRNYVDKDTIKNYNLKFSSGYGLEEIYNGSAIGFTDDSTPCIVERNRQLAVASDSLTGNYTYFTFPDKHGTIALQEDIKSIYSIGTLPVITEAEYNKHLIYLFNNELYFLVKVDNEIKYKIINSYYKDELTGTGSITIDKEGLYEITDYLNNKYVIDIKYLTANTYSNQVYCYDEALDSYLYKIEYDKSLHIIKLVDLKGGQDTSLFDLTAKILKLY